MAKMAIVGGLLVDGNGGEPVEDGVVLIDGERIEAAGSADQVAVPEDAEHHALEQVLRDLHASHAAEEIVVDSLPVLVVERLERRRGAAGHLRFLGHTGR